MNRRMPAAERGVTLVELMIAVAILSIGVLGLVGAFMGIQRATQVAKNKTIATGLAQEKLQILGQLNYDQVLVTASPSYRTDYTPSIPYDTVYFPPESVLEGGVTYTRLTDVQVVTETGGVLTILPPTTPDTGMRQVTSYILWTEGSQKKSLSLSTVLSNPYTITSNSNFVGTMQDASSMNPIIGGQINIAENQGWLTTTGAGGNYGMNTAPGNFTMVASAHGYFTQFAPVTIAPNATVTQNFSMVAMASGTVTGTAWVNPNPVISQVVVSTAQADKNGFQAQYIELYNPTQNVVPVVTGGVPQLNLNFQSAPGCGDAATCLNIQLIYISTAIQPYGYYVVANTSTFMINGASITADAVYSPSANTACTTEPTTWNLSSIPPVMAIMSQQAPNGHGGALWLTNTAGSVLDTVGWTHNGNTPPQCAPYCIPFTAGSGFAPNTQIVRTSSPNFASNVWGRAYDTSISSIDFVYPPIITGFPFQPFSSQSPPQMPIAGRPAIGGVVSASDGLSSPSTITAFGYPPVGNFTLPSVATATIGAPWVVTITSGAWMLENDTVTIPTMGSIYNFPSSTTFLTSPNIKGFIAGYVTDVLGNPISLPSPVTVSPGSSGLNVMASATNGRYILRVTSGAVNVTANPGNLDSGYVAVTSAAVTANLGQITDGVNFQLAQGGRVSGFVTRDGVNGLPGVTVSLINMASGASADTEVTDNTGRFSTLNVSTGAYQVVPELDSLEFSSPANQSVTVLPGAEVFSSTFTVTGALGTISGTVTSGGQPISSGVLIVVTTSTLPGGPPALSSTTQSSSAIYLASSQEDGTYSVGVRQSTAPSYNIYAYYTTVTSTGGITSQSASITGVPILSGSTVTGKNFAW